VVATFNAIRQGQFSNSSIDVTNDRGSKLKNTAIFGLGVVLLERSRSRLLLEPSSSEDGGDAAEGSTAEREIRERLAACSQVPKKSVAVELGPRYGVPQRRSEMYFVGGRRRSLSHGGAEELL
jgi:hypothetical protein